MCVQSLYANPLEGEQDLVKAMTADMAILNVEDMYGIDDDDDEDEQYYRRLSSGQEDITTPLVDTKCCVCQSGSLNDPSNPTIVLHSRLNL